MMSSCLVHCLCYKGWGAPSSKELLAVAAAVAVAVEALGFAGCRATDGVVVLAGWKDGVKGSAPVLGFELEPTGVESRGAAGAGAGVDGVGVGCGAVLQV